MRQIRFRTRVVLFCHSSMVVTQRFLFRAQDQNMTNGDYVFVTYVHYVSSTSTLLPWDAFNFTGENADQRKQLFYAVKQITIADLMSPNVTSFLDSVRLASGDAPWFFNVTSVNVTDPPTSLQAVYLYDAVYLYLSIVDEMVEDGQNYRDGSLVAHEAINHSMKGLLGDINIDSNADRINKFAVLTYGPGDSKYYSYMTIDFSLPIDKRVCIEYTPMWGIYNTVPLDIPVCGFGEELCTLPKADFTVTIIVSCAVGCVVLIIILSVGQLIRAKRNESRIQQMIWKVNYDEILFINMTCSSTVGKSLRNLSMLSIHDQISSMGTERTVAIYKGQTVAVYTVRKHEVSLTRRDLIELINMKELTHDNIKVFVGVRVRRRQQLRFLSERASNPGVSAT